MADTIPLYFSSALASASPSSQHASGYPKSVRASQDSMASFQATVTKPSPPPLPPKPIGLSGSPVSSDAATYAFPSSSSPPLSDSASVNYPTYSPSTSSATSSGFFFPRISPKKQTNAFPRPPALPPRKGSAATLHVLPVNPPPTRIRQSSSPQPYFRGQSPIPSASVKGLNAVGGREWSTITKLSAGLFSKGKGKLQDRLQARYEASNPSGSVSTSGSSTSSVRSQSPSSHQYSLSSLNGRRSSSNPLSAFGLSTGTTHAGSKEPSPGVKLPAVILGVRVPRRQGQAFGIALEQAVEATRVAEDGLHRRKVVDEVFGDEARRWLPAIAFRCLEYLDRWGQTEEGIYRVPGSSLQIAQLRALFDAGCDCDLKEFAVSELEPNTIASLFKAWLRELPQSLLSDNLEAAVDVLVREGTGYPASSSLLEQIPALPAPPTSTPPDGKAPRELVEKLSSLFSGGMPAEEFYLLRAVSYHLARLASHSATNKMTLRNLYLVLVPTLRLSPKMLQILVEEREILFAQPNEAARILVAAAETVPAFSSNPHGSRRPSIPASSSQPSPASSPRLQPPSPRLTSASLLSLDFDTTRHADVSARLPIADRFGSGSEPPSPDPTSPTSHFSPPTPTSSKPFVPARSPNGSSSSFFGASRDPVRVAKEASRPPLPQLPPPPSAVAERHNLYAAGIPEREPLEPLPTGGEQAGDQELLEQSRPSISSDGGVSYESHASHMTGSSSASGSMATESLSHSSGTGSIAHATLVSWSPRPVKRSSPPVPLLSLPVGLGLAAGDEGSRDSWGLLNFEERKRFFES